MTPKRRPPALSAGAGRLSLGRPPFFPSQRRQTAHSQEMFR